VVITLRVPFKLLQLILCVSILLLLFCSIMYICMHYVGSLRRLASDSDMLRRLLNCRIIIIIIIIIIITLHNNYVFTQSLLALLIFYVRRNSYRLDVRPSVCPSVCHTLILYQNG